MREIANLDPLTCSNHLGYIAPVTPEVLSPLQASAFPCEPWALPCSMQPAKKPAKADPAAEVHVGRVSHSLPGTVMDLPNQHLLPSNIPPPLLSTDPWGVLGFEADAHLSLSECFPSHGER